ncbi:hypothetical protein [Methylobacterium sp. B1]|uniref:hypothetical protein n=1 Tax=Methylobacterium sp. B1 TaxID=91459 RepID=UPI000348731D|nr:hypothetical protein [Methylobacterium sp. B1]
MAEPIFSGRSVSRIKSAPGGVPVRLLAPRDVGFVLADLEALESMEVDHAASDLASVRIAAGDVVVTSRGPARAAVAREEHAGAIATANLVVLRVGEPSLRHVIAAYLRAPSTARRLQARSIGTATIGFGTQDIKDLEIDLPGSGDLAALDELVSLTDRYVAAAQNGITARMEFAQQLVTRSLDLGGARR